MSEKSTSYTAVSAQQFTLVFNCRLEDAPRQLDELQSSQEEVLELSHLRNQLERATSRMGALEGELVEARRTKERMDEFMLGFEEELEKK